MDPATRRAALWASLIAAPLTVLITFLAITQLSADRSTGRPGATGATPTATALPHSTAPVQVAAPVLAEWPATVCRALLARLPGTVADLAQRPVTAGPEQNAAYGDPAMTVTCGVAPARVALTDKVWVVDGVCWHLTQRSEGAELTTVDREVPVRVTVPGDYQPPLQWVAPLADPVRSSVRSIDDVPSGCQS